MWGTNAGVSRKLVNFVLVLVGELVGSIEVLRLLDVIGLYQRAEHWEAIARIQRRIIAVCVHSCAPHRFSVIVRGSGTES